MITRLLQFSVGIFLFAGAFVCQSNAAQEILLSGGTLYQSIDLKDKCVITDCRMTGSFGGCKMDLSSPLAYAAVEEVLRGKHFVKIRVIRNFVRVQTGIADRISCNPGDIGVVDLINFDTNVKEASRTIESERRAKQIREESDNELRQMFAD